MSGFLKDHLSRCIVEIAEQLNLENLYAAYGGQGGEVKTLMQKAEEIDRFFDPNYFPMLSPIRIDIKTIPLYNTHTSFINGIQYENTRLLRL
jgi:hypothetical protein